MTAVGAAGTDRVPVAGIALGVQVAPGKLLDLIGVGSPVAMTVNVVAGLIGRVVARLRTADNIPAGIDGDIGYPVHML